MGPLVVLACDETRLLAPGTVKPYDEPRGPRAARLETAVTLSYNVPETALTLSFTALIAGSGSPPLPGFWDFLPLSP